MKKTYYDNQSKIIITEISGIPTLDQFKEIANSILYELEKNNTNKILNDTSNLKGNSLEIQDWTQQVWFSKAEELGLKYVAFIAPSDIFGQVSAEQTNEIAEEEGAIEIKYFDDIEKATNWLNNK